MRRCAFCNSVRPDDYEPCYSCGKEGETRTFEPRERFEATPPDKYDDMRRRMSESAKARWAAKKAGLGA